MAFMFAIFAALFLLFTACPSDSTGPSIYFLAKDGVTIDKKGDTTILLYTKYVDPGCYVEDNASMNDDIQVTSDLETVLPIEKKIASHIGEVKKTGDYTITYTAIDEAGNAGQRTKIITCKNVSDIYAGRYWTVRDDIVGQGSSDICHAARYYSNVTASANVAGRIRFSKVALHEYQGQKVSFKVDADLYSPELSSRTRSDQVGFLGTASDKEVVFYNGIFTWLVRLGGFLLMFFGLSMVLKPLSVLADVLPILGNIVEMGNGLVAGIIALVCSLVTIAIAWIFYRPVLAIFLLVLAAGGIFLLWKKRQAKKAAAAPAAPAAPSAAF